LFCFFFSFCSLTALFQVTLAYFQLLHAVKQSEFLNVPSSAAASTKLNLNPPSSASPPSSVFIQQVSVSLDDYVRDDLRIVRSDIPAATLSAFESQLDSAVPKPSFKDIQYSDKRTAVYTFAFNDQSDAHAWADVVSKMNVSTSDDEGDFGIQPARDLYGGNDGISGIPVREMRSVTWMAYALRAFVIRFWNLAKVRSRTVHLFERKGRSFLSPLLESRLGRHFCNASRLRPDARNLCYPFHQHAQAR
jgi:hypothetical protein